MWALIGMFPLLVDRKEQAGLLEHVSPHSAQLTEPFVLRSGDVVNSRIA